MTAGAASVIIVSRHRATTLIRCLVALSQQDHPRFEVIVVADPEGIAAAQTTGLHLKTQTFDDANISAARNLGLMMAGAPVVAFIDDDAVAEPTWLSRLCQPFTELAVIASTGFVRGRNGISYQWQACAVDATGMDHALRPVAATYRSSPDRAVKTQGTNCAFRRETLAGIGGFDPAFRFYLDEADVNLRLAGLGLTAIVPDAQVHHGFAASVRRRADRVPTSLREIAASSAVFLRRHAPDAAQAESVALIESQRARVARLVAENRISPSEADTLSASLAEGWDEGMARPLAAPPAITGATGFSALPGTGPRQGRILSGRIWQKARLLREAADRTAAGEIVTVICLAPTPHAHRMEFTPGGFWLQSGGLFGWSERQGRRLRFKGFAARVAEETARLRLYRPTGQVG